MVKKPEILFLIVMILVLTEGCVSMPMRQYSKILPKTNKIYLEKAKPCELRAVSLGFQLSFGELSANPSAMQFAIMEVYAVSLKKELEKRGFVLAGDSSEKGTAIVKTKIGEISPKMMTYGLGLVGVEIEVCDESGKPLFSFQQAVNTHFIGSRAKKQIKKFIAPRVARQLKKKFL